MKGTSIAFAIGLMMALGTSVVSAEEYVYGRELMTDQELAEHRATLQSLQTEEAREAYLMAHHERMEQRAEEQGVQLPQEAPAAGNRGGMGKEDSMGRHPRSMPGGSDMNQGGGYQR